MKAKVTKHSITIDGKTYQPGETVSFTKEIEYENLLRSGEVEAVAAAPAPTPSAPPAPAPKHGKKRKH